MQAPPHPDLRFEIQAREGAARAARFQTAHGEVRTPAFMPVATRASLKGLTQGHLRTIAPEVLLSNTYHLHLRPGEDVVRDLGGLHAFTGWDGPMLTDSGGYQVFSLTNLVRLTEEGAHLKSHLDGEPLFLGPREAMAIQEALGADIVMAFDHCPALPATHDVIEAAVDRTTRWARTCAEARTRHDQALFGIVQGGTDAELRTRSAHALIDLDLPGYAIGGLAVGESEDDCHRTLVHTAPLLPTERPRYLMGIGMPSQVLDAVHEGMDMFDCVLPSRMGRRGHLFTRDGVLRVGARRFERDEAPLDPECDCEVCRTHSRAYLRHLFTTKEHTATTLGTLHNIHFYVALLRQAREAIVEQRFEAFRRSFIDRYEEGERAWRRLIDADPHGREGSRRARAERDSRRDAYSSSSDDG